MGTAITFFDNKQGYQWYEYSTPGNLFYGHIGSAAGFSGIILHGGASYAGITDPSHTKGKDGNDCCPCPEGSGGVCRLALCGYYKPEWAFTGFDDPKDYNAVQFGVDLYAIHKDGLTFSQFILELSI